jgi:hypothetical protein
MTIYQVIPNSENKLKNLYYCEYYPNGLVSYERKVERDKIYKSYYFSPLFESKIKDAYIDSIEKFSNSEIGENYIFYNEFGTIVKSSSITCNENKIYDHWVNTVNYSNDSTVKEEIIVSDFDFDYLYEKYGEQNKLEKQIDFTPYYADETSYLYNYDGKLIQVINRLNNDTTCSSSIYIYDDKHLIKRLHYGNDKLWSYNVYEYNEFDSLVVLSYFIYDTLHHKEEYFYNSDNLLIEQDNYYYRKDSMVVKKKESLLKNSLKEYPSVINDTVIVWGDRWVNKEPTWVNYLDYNIKPTKYFFYYEFYKE